jgi:photosystem II stability/assembly factor-like uncharacterized protein
MLLAAANGPQASQAAVDPALLGRLSWRLLGPFGGGPTTAVAGVPADPHVFYAGMAAGGLWKTTDAGRTWRPIFDEQPTGAIGAVAVASSSPNIVFVGTGEPPLTPGAARGAGLFKSTDGGATWHRAGLSSDPHITSIVIDPRSADRLFVASAGRPGAPGPDRGIYRSVDGGRTFERVFFHGDHAGAFDLTLDASNPAIVYGSLVDWQEPGASSPAPPKVVKSTDGGTTWAAADAGIAPEPGDRVHRVRITSSPSEARRLFAIVHTASAGSLYRSDDGAATWRLVPSAKAFGAGAIESVQIDARDAETVYLLGHSALRSTDGGRTFAPYRADGPDGSARALWNNPVQPAIAIVGGDSGAAVTLNGGETWSSVSNQPTGRFTDVTTDASFPYRVCAASPDGPAGCVPSRTHRGRITAMDWEVVGSAPGVMVVPDPQNAEFIFSGTLERIDRRSGQAQFIGPVAPDGQRAATGRMAFTADGRTLYYGSNVLYRSVPGQSWSVVSSDLTRGDGSISVIRPSAIDSRIVWVGTNDGLIHLTRDAGASWTSVTPTALSTDSVADIEPSHFDVNTAYAAAGLRSNGTGPSLWRTRDGGRTWQAIDNVLPDEAAVFSIREDALRRGLLFAATSSSVFVSFDDGDRWQPLRLNLPPVPVTRLAIKDADLVIATGGRGLWVLDDISALRQITADILRADMFLFRPAVAWRTPPSRPAPSADSHDASARNPPDGVALTYVARRGPEPITIEIIETLSGEVIRRFEELPSGDGLQHVIWDLKYTPVNGRGLWVMPGTYQVRLTAGTRIARQAVIVRMDPRVRATVADLSAQFKISRALDEQRRLVAAALAKPSAAPADPPRSHALMAIADELDRVFDVLQQADARPTAAAESMATAAIARAAAALAGAP